MKFMVKEYRYKDGDLEISDEEKQAIIESVKQVCRGVGEIIIKIKYQNKATSGYPWYEKSINIYHEGESCGIDSGRPGSFSSPFL